MADEDDIRTQDAARPSEPAWHGRVIGDRYRLLRVIGAGGMGTVHEAVHLVTGAPAAVKVPSAACAADPELRARFRAEAEALSDLSHPSIVRLLDAGGFEEGEPFLAFELLEGESLAARLEARGPLPVLDALRVGEAVASALDAAHARGFVHRDVKPENVFLHRGAGGREEVRLLDFGIAKGAGNMKLTFTGEVLGSARYMPPEQLQDSSEVGPAADIYALGVLLYEVLSGRAPFEAGSFHELAQAIAYDDPPPLTSLRSDVPLWLERAVHAALAKDPAVRPNTALALVSVEAARELPRVRPSARPSVVAPEISLLVAPGAVLSSEAGAQRVHSPGQALRTAVRAALGGAFLFAVFSFVARVEYDAEAQFGRRLPARVALAAAR